jgi:hypothetical protein
MISPSVDGWTDEDSSLSVSVSKLRLRLAQVVGTPTRIAFAASVAWTSVAVQPIQDMRAVVVQGECHSNCSANLSPLVMESLVGSAPRVVGAWLMAMGAEKAFDDEVRRWPVGSQLAGIGWCLRSG